jgi:D-methionine transport system substrate-binding protein
VTGNPYRNFLAVNDKDANAPWVHALVQSYQQPNVAAEILSVYHGATLPAWNDASH